MLVSAKRFSLHGIILLLAGVLYLLAGSASAVAGGVLRCGIQVNRVDVLDPHRAAASQDRMAADLMFNGLLRYQPGNAPYIEADLAEQIPEFKIVDGKQVWTVRLKKGIMFHAGPKTPPYEMTADDVVYSLKKAADPGRSAYAGDYAGMNVEKIDRYTLNITMETPLSSILFFPKISNYAGGFIVSRRAIEEGVRALSATPGGDRAFLFSKQPTGREAGARRQRPLFQGRAVAERCRS